METRSNHILVGVVTLTLLAVLAAFLVWIVRFGDGATKEYDIFFAQSVGGLASRAPMLLLPGVPSGQVLEGRALEERIPDFVRVRIAVTRRYPDPAGHNGNHPEHQLHRPAQYSAGRRGQERRTGDYRTGAGGSSGHSNQAGRVG